jgi:excisionase family DNA binding protein
MEGMLTAPEVAEWLNVKVITIRKWTSAKKIPSVKLSGKAVRYPERLLKEWIAEKTFGVAQKKPDIFKQKGGKKQTGRPSYKGEVGLIIEHAKSEVLGMG